MSKNIILLADGTGNGAAKFFKTNVWRLYTALDLNDSPADGQRRQVAYYHDGIGSSKLKLLAIPASITGFGLKRNVLAIYKFLCRNYEDGDRIFLFGFSRGSFTMRVICGLISTQGILRCKNEEELSRYVPDAYRAHRRHYKLSLVRRKDKTNPPAASGNIGLVDFLRNLRDSFIRWRRHTSGIRQYEDVQRNNAMCEVDFIGVWDTVAAYGLPLAEMVRGIDNWVFPLSMPDYELPSNVLTARHALSLDDERDSFHPLLWDEVAEEKLVSSGRVPMGRISQVWFAGAHSNVGGGYPDDTLSHVSLEWMMNESSKPLRPGDTIGLRYIAPAREDPTQPTELGVIHDSRSGIGAYYRYQPRRISALLEHPDPATTIMQDPDRKGVGFLKSVTIHESVLRRIIAGTDGYAPIVIPDRFQIMQFDGTIVSGQLPPPTPAQGQTPVSRVEWVWNDVWRLRVNIAVTFLATSALVYLPVIHKTWPPSVCAGPQCVLSLVFNTIGSIQ
jgi:uncharacterized protein (DUF2235 family)